MKGKRSSALLLCIAVAIVAGAAVYRFTLDRSAIAALYADERIRMEIRTMQPVAQPMAEAGFRLRIVEPSGKPVSGAELKLHITMPGMFCGVFPADIVEEEPGLYYATAVPVMEGRWQADATLHRDNRTAKVRAYFEVRQTIGEEVAAASSWSRRSGSDRPWEADFTR